MFDVKSRKDPSAYLARSGLWAAAYEKYIRLWITLARSTEISDNEARDMVHAVIVSILTGPPRQFESLEHARNYVAKSVLNRVRVMKVRGARRYRWGDDVEARFAVNPEEAPGDDNRQRAALRGAIMRLTRKDFNILKLRFYSGFTLSQTSEILSIPISTIASREVAILRRMRIRLEKAGFGTSSQ